MPHIEGCKCPILRGAQIPHIEGLNGTLMRLFPWQSRAEQPKELRGNPLDNPSNSLSLTGGLEWLFSGGRETDAGELINDQTALKISTVYACVRVLSESVASLPIRLLRVSLQSNSIGRNVISRECHRWQSIMQTLDGSKDCPLENARLGIPRTSLRC
jgi:hypothetical protein